MIIAVFLFKGAYVKFLATENNTAHITNLLCYRNLCVYAFSYVLVNSQQSTYIEMASICLLEVIGLNLCDAICFQSMNINSY